MIVTGRRRRTFSSLLAQLAACAVLMLGVGMVYAQDAANPPVGIAPTTEPQQQMPPPSGQQPSRPGLLSAIGRWVDDSMSTMSSGWSGARDAVDGFGGQASEAAKNAAGAARDAAAAAAVVIPPASLVLGHQHCVRAANGAPDCQAATAALCRSKGFSGGSSLHIQSEQKCPVWGWVSGKKPVGECGTETYVTSAMCR